MNVPPASPPYNEDLETAMQAFFQALKRPQRWSAITALAGVNLDRPAGMMLSILRQHPAGQHVQALAQQLNIEAPSVTRKTQELERLGYVLRLPDPTDRRAVKIMLTANGEQIAQTIRKAQRAMVTDALQTWKPEDITKLASLLLRFSDDLTRQHEQ